MDNANNLKLCRDLLDALSYLEAQGMHHGDLKPSNILRTARGKFILTDVLLEDILNSITGETHQFSPSLDSYRYMAPELFSLNAGRSIESDIWSLGLILLEVFTDNVFPFKSKVPHVLMS